MTDFNDWYERTPKTFPSSQDGFIARMRQAYEAGAAAQAGTLRDHFAGQALSGMCANNNGQWMRQNGAAWAYRIADAMLEARNMTKEQVS